MYRIFFISFLYLTDKTKNDRKRQSFFVPFFYILKLMNQALEKRILGFQIQSLVYKLYTEGGIEKS